MFKKGSRHEVNALLKELTIDPKNPEIAEKLENEVSKIPSFFKVEDLNDLKLPKKPKK